MTIERGVQRFTREAQRLQTMDLWYPVTHDRRVELVFIGDERMQKDRIQAAVEAAMLTPEELQSLMDSWETESSPLTPINTAAANPFARVPRCVNI